MPLNLRNDDDLFKDSTMSFGEHLEELRVALFKSLIGLVLAFIVGLYFGKDVVKFFETPIKEALTRFYDKSGQSVGGYIATQHFVSKEELAALVQGHALPGTEARKEEAAAKKEKASKGFFESLAGYFSSEKAIEEPPKPAPVMLPLTIYQKTEDSRLVQLTTLNPQEAFVIYIKAALVAGLVLASPWIFYQIWNFVGAGLYPHEKKYVHIFLPVSLMLFLMGASLAFFAVFRFVLDFLFWFNGQMDLNPDVRISEWLSFVLLMPVCFGISFQLPLVMLFLERIHIFTVQKYLSNWRISVLVIFIGSMVLSPGGDPYSMLLMAIPLCILFYLGIALCKWLPKMESPFEAMEKEPDKEKLNV